MNSCKRYINPCKRYINSSKRDINSFKRFINPCKRIINPCKRHLCRENKPSGKHVREICTPSNPTPKHRLWVHVRTASARRFLHAPTIYVLSKNKKNINIFLVKFIFLQLKKFSVYCMGKFS